MTTTTKKRTTAKSKTRKTTPVKRKTTAKRKVKRTTKHKKTKSEPMDGTAKKTGIKKVIRTIKAQLKNLENKVG